MLDMNGLARVQFASYSRDEWPKIVLGLCKNENYLHVDSF